MGIIKNATRVDAKIERQILAGLGKRNRKKDPLLTLDIYRDPDTQITAATVRWALNKKPNRQMGLEDAICILMGMGRLEVEYDELNLYGIGEVLMGGKIADMPIIRVTMSAENVTAFDWNRFDAWRHLQQHATVYFHPGLEK